MKFITKLSIFLILFASMFFAAKFSSAHEIKTLNSIPEDRYPYKLIEILPSGLRGEEYVGVSDKRTLFDIAKEIGAKPYKKDKFTVFPELRMQMGGTITMYRTPNFKILDGKKSFAVKSWAKTVGDLLVENKIELGQDDKINFSVDTEISDSMQIKIIRVAKTIVIENEDIAYDITKKDDPNMDKGKTRVEKAGEKGIKKYSYLVTREDGVEISKVLQNTEVTKQSVTEILYVGTRPVITVPCKFNDTVIAASLKYSLDPNSLCYRMMRESRGNPSSDGGAYKGLFQYDPGLWSSISPKAGYSGASIWDATAQINVTAWAWTHGYRSRWPSP